MRGEGGGKTGRAAVFGSSSCGDSHVGYSFGSRTEARTQQLPGVLQRIASTHELMAYAVIALSFLSFLSVVIAVVGLYRADARHREALEIMKEIRSASDRVGYFLFRKLGPVELP